ncbi:MAG TPA: hypothetical protein VFQ88_11040 [Nevskiaceae bacterium]|nr:hypothetical protein [Nevskiaceae bacterium]
MARPAQRGTTAEYAALWSGDYQRLQRRAQDRLARSGWLAFWVGAGGWDDLKRCVVNVNQLPPWNGVPGPEEAKRAFQRGQPGARGIECEIRCAAFLMGRALHWSMDPDVLIEAKADVGAGRTQSYDRWVKALASFWRGQMKNPKHAMPSLQSLVVAAWRSGVTLNMVRGFPVCAAVYARLGADPETNVWPPVTTAG